MYAYPHTYIHTSLHTHIFKNCYYAKMTFRKNNLFDNSMWTVLVFTEAVFHTFKNERPNTYLTSNLYQS